MCIYVKGGDDDIVQCHKEDWGHMLLRSSEDESLNAPSLFKSTADFGTR